MASLPLAATIGYLTGLILSYFLMANRVFVGGWLRNHKSQEIFLFLISGVLGAFLTYITVLLAVTLLNAGPNLAKFFAISTSFFGVYLFRKYIVFKIN